MAYTKHTWLARLGTGLNKFLNSGTSTNLVLTPNPDSITQQGSPFSATWMNEMEQGIYNGNTLTGTSAPTTSTAGVVGQLYLNTTNGYLYKCTAASTTYTWANVADLFTMFSALSSSTPSTTSKLPFYNGSSAYYSTLADLIANGGAAKIATGSYVGTGTYGSANPNSLTFSFVPKFLLVLPNISGSNSANFVIWNGTTYSPNTLTNKYNYNVFSLSGSTLSWYSAGQEAYQDQQCNASDYTYNYVVIG